MRKKNNVFKNSIIYTISNLMIKAFSFFLIPIYTSCLSTEEYGVVNLTSGFFSVAAALLTLSLNYAVVRYYAEYKNDKNIIAKIIGSSLTFILLISVLFISTSMLMGNMLSSLFFGGLPVWPIVFLSVFISVFSAVYTFYQEILKGMQQATKSVIFSYVYFFLLLISNIIVVVYYRLGAEGVLWSNIVVNLIMTIIMFIDLLQSRLIKFGLDLKLLGKLLRYSLPLVPHTVAYNVSNYATKIIITEKLSLSMLGIYSLASQFGNIADVVLNSVQAAYQPWMFEKLKKSKEDTNEKLRQAIYVLMWIYGFLFLGISCFAQEAITIVADKSYMSAWLYVPMVVVSVCLKIPLYFYNSYMYYDVTKTKYVFISTLVGCIVNIFMTYMLVQELHIYGSIIADIVAMFARQFVVMKVLPKEAKKIYSVKEMTFFSILPIIFIAMATLPAYYLKINDINVFNIIYKIVVILIYCGIAAIVNKNKIRNFYSSIKERRNKI